MSARDFPSSGEPDSNSSFYSAVGYWVASGMLTGRFSPCSQDERLADGVSLIVLKKVIVSERPDSQ